ncbi:hypothetical protein SAMN05216276_103354 [Streptosporangium subroseum]|uniref:Uncharacterized protein n=1 Tax=Streptosporangium subroseum TaxID=106412 RepID=A0A239LKH5_9ACTN|nr:hypothetical protein [Streptosporangium subroseum]SNT30323.1 hypothetical protein SAMN05216276_103354 [Streptosporangium subroseum]
MYKIQESGLLDLVLEAHGGIERWSRARTIRARLDMSGPAWTALGQEKIFANLDVAVDVHEQRTVFTGFTGPGLRGVYTPDRVAIEDRRDTVLQERHAPRESSPVRDGDARWDPLHALYFGGYGMWNYLTTPYLLTLPGVRTEELEPWQAGGEQWRRLRVTFPPRIATHSTEQTFYYDKSGVQRKLDYAPYVMGDRPAEHHTEAHRTVSGLLFPTHRYVLPVQDGRPGPTPIIIVDFSDITVDFAD